MGSQLDAMESLDEHKTEKVAVILVTKTVGKFLCQIVFQANHIRNIWSNNDKYTGSSAHNGQTGCKKMSLIPMAFAQEVWKNWKGL